MFEDTLPKMQRCLVHNDNIGNGMEFGAFRNVIEGYSDAGQTVKQYIYNTMIFDMDSGKLEKEMNEIKPAFYPVVGELAVMVKDPGMFVYSTKLVVKYELSPAMPRIASPEVEVLGPNTIRNLDGATSGVLASTQQVVDSQSHISVTPVAGQAYTMPPAGSYFSRVYYLDDIKTGGRPILDVGQYQEVDLQGVPWDNDTQDLDNEIQQRVIREILVPEISRTILQAAFVPENLKLLGIASSGLRMNVIDYCLRKIRQHIPAHVRQWDSITRWYELSYELHRNIYAKFLRVWCAHKGRKTYFKKLKNMRVIEKCSLRIIHEDTSCIAHSNMSAGTICSFVPGE
ncbi:hypothetical protein SPFM9_00295 [Salmonella phage SPFM9]|nr:hypothetical protein SPFM9_00295 [Salmonella phage SPFM9]